MSATATTTATEDVVMGEGFTTTEKGALSLATSGSARVDLFFKTARGISNEQLKKLLDAAWAEDKLDTLKIIFHARDCRGGKGERQIFRDAISWVIENCEKNFLINLDLCVELGRWEDLLWFLGGKSTTVTEAIANKFAKQLKQDVEDMKAKKSISLAAKWAPTENCKHDKKNHAAKFICTALGVNYKTYRKEYLTPLRNYIKVVERLMCDKKWNEIEYSKVPGVAMNKLKKAFAKNDKERFEEWKAKLVKGEAKVNATTVEPHDLCRQYFRANQKDDVIEEQWKVIVERVKQLGSLSDSIVLSDVSGSMSGTPMEVSVALGILISGLTAEPFKGQIITFESNPHFHSVQGSTLYEQVKDVLSMSWGGSTNFQAAFDRILEKAQQFGLSPEQMPKRLYVISDMQFDSACEGNWMTNYQAIQVKYQQAGYPVPEIVFWNVNGRTGDVATKADQQGVALISGFSPSILKSVLTGKTISPYDVLRAAIDDKRYSTVKLAQE